MRDFCKWDPKYSGSGFLHWGTIRDEEQEKVALSGKDQGSFVYQEERWSDTSVPAVWVAAILNKTRGSALKTQAGLGSEECDILNFAADCRSISLWIFHEIVK